MMRRNFLGLFVLLVAVVVGFNTYSVLKMEKQVEDISGKLTTGSVVQEAQLAPLDVMIIEQSDCTQCTDLKKVIESLKSQLNVREVNVLDENTGSTLVKKYALKKLPVVIFSPEMAEYKDIASRWELFGEVAEDGNYLLTKANPPYYDLEAGEVRGLVKLTNVVDASCTECYDVASHKVILQNIGMHVESEETVDVSSEEGKALVEMHKIESVPTIILSKDASVYELFTKAWVTVGSVEDDGSFVYRKNEILMGKYKNLVTGEVKDGQPPQALLPQDA